MGGPTRPDGMSEGSFWMGSTKGEDAAPPKPFLSAMSHDALRNLVLFANLASERLQPQIWSLGRKAWLLGLGVALAVAAPKPSFSV